jgi:hypothetical protein
VFNRRVFLGGAASAAILASSVFTAGAALADATPQVTDTASMLSAAGPAAQLPGIAGALQALPTGSTLSGGSSPVTGAAPSAVPANAPSGVNSGPGTSTPSSATSGLSGASAPTSDVSGVTSGASGVSDMGSPASDALGSGTSVIPALGGLSGMASGSSADGS